MSIKQIRKQSKKLVTALLISAALGGTLAGCSEQNAMLGSTNTIPNVLAKQSKSQQDAIINEQETSYLKHTGNLLAIQADKHVQHINATQHQRYPIPYIRSSDGNYWSWFQTHYLPHHIIKEVARVNQSDASDKNINSDQQAEYDANKFDNQIQQNLAKHNINYGINYAILGNSVSNVYDAQQNGDAHNLHIRFLHKDTAQKNINKLETKYLKNTGNKKAKADDAKIEKLDKQHHQKYPIPYTKSKDGNYWSWYKNHKVPHIIISGLRGIEEKHDSDYGLSSDTGYITHRFDNDIQYNLLKHDVDYGANYNKLSSQTMNHFQSYENN